jgi:transposase
MAALRDKERPKLVSVPALRRLLRCSPAAYGFPMGEWTMSTIRQLIENEFGVHYSRAYVHTLYTKKLGWRFVWALAPKGLSMTSVASELRRPALGPREEALEAQRREAIRLIRAGARRIDVARELQVSTVSVWKWWSLYRKGGLRALRVRPRRRSETTVTPELRARLPGLLKQGASAHGFPSAEWTTARVAALIEREFGVRCSQDHSRMILYSLGWRRRLVRPAL